MRDEGLAARAGGSAAEAFYGSNAVLGIDEAFELAADEVGARIEQLAEAGKGAMRACLPQWISSEDPGWAQFEERLGKSLAAELDCFRQGALPGSLPAHDAFIVDVACQLGELDPLLRGYRFAHASLWGAWFEAVGRTRTTSGVRQELLDRGARFFLRYAELISRYLADAYRRRAERAGQTAHAAPADVRLVDGNPFADARMAFDFDRHHLGVIVSGGMPEATARRLATCLNRVVEVRERGRSWWVCLSGHEEISERGMRELDAFVPEPGVRLAIGRPGFGEEGLCASFRQALLAQALATPGVAVTHYADIAVEALTLRDEDDVRAFVADELRGISDDSPDTRRLRETLAAYFACDLNAASTAARLGVHQQTVANRLRAIEDRLGRSLMARPLELALALRLRERVAA